MVKAAESHVVGVKLDYMGDPQIDFIFTPTCANSGRKIAPSGKSCVFITDGCEPAEKKPLSGKLSDMQECTPEDESLIRKTFDIVRHQLPMIFENQGRWKTAKRADMPISNAPLSMSSEATIYYDEQFDAHIAIVKSLHGQNVQPDQIAFYIGGGDKRGEGDESVEWSIMAPVYLFPGAFALYQEPQIDEIKKK